MATAPLPEGAVVRVSRGTFDPARFAEVQAMTIATGRYLVPAISRLPGLISYYAGASPGGSVIHVSIWDSDEKASQMSQLKNSGANVFFNVSTPKFAAQAIKKAAEIGWKPAHYINNVSTSIATVMKPAGFENAQGILSAYYLKDPTDPQFAKDKDFLEWKAFMQKYYPTGNLLDASNGYAYAVSNLLRITLKQCGDDLTRANVMKQAANLKDVQLPMVLDGIKVNTSPTDFYPIQ